MKESEFKYCPICGGQIAVLKSDPHYYQCSKCGLRYEVGHNAEDEIDSIYIADRVF